MKKVLIITYRFPPKPGIASIRPAGLAKYLPENGWEAIILTSLLPVRPETPFKIIETLPFFPERLPNRPEFKTRQEELSSPPLPSQILLSLPELLPFPTTKIGWKVCALYSARKIIRKEKISAVISTFKPATVHFIAAVLKKEFPDLCWIADFRDLWTQNHTYKRRGLKRRLEIGQEMKTLRNADFLTTVSELWAQKLKDRHQKPSFAIPNGFDPSEWTTEPFKPADKFIISYTGSIYFGKKAQDVTPFLNVVRSLIDEELIKAEDMEVTFYGDTKINLDIVIRERGLKKIVLQQGLIPRQEVLKKQRQSQLLLLLDWNDPKELGVCPGKLYEYLAARRPVLSVGGHNGAVKDVLQETGAGFYCRTEMEIKDVLLQCYREFKKRGGVSYRGREEAVMRYSHRVMARKFAEILNKNRKLL
ncbi:MAG: glycosyltransferase [Candidatus Omnitrophota bacterium]